MPNGEPSVKELAWFAASQLLETNHFVTLTDTEEILIYQDGIYQLGGETHIQAKVEENFAVKQEVSTHLVNEVVGHVKRSTLKPRKIFDQADNPHLVLQNCLLNLKTGKPEPFRSDYFALNKMPVTYDSSKDCKNFKKFLLEILSPEDAEGVQEELGAILRKRYLTKKFSIYLGETDTGKTTLVNVILALLGEENVSNVSIQQLGLRDRFALAELYGKMANIRDDLGKDVIYTVGKLKELTGSFSVQAEKKFRDPFSFTNYAYLIFTCNVLPAVEEDDNAFFNRVIIRRFSKKFGGKERPDRELIDKLTTPDELSGILNWTLEGLKRLEQNGWNFSNTTSLEITREDYKRRSDPVWAFVQNRIEVNSEGVVAKETLYNSFKKYCEDNEIPLPSKDGFFKTLPENVTVVSAYREMEEGKGRKHSFVGIKLVLNGENPAHHAQPARNQGTFDADKTKDVQGVQPVHGFANIIDATCEYCGTFTPCTKDAEGRYACSKCVKEVKPSLESIPNESPPAQANCAKCGISLGMGTGRTIFNQDGKTWCLEHLPKKKEAES